tara:strand:+ start:142 stop:822 length:681 start_codon:yes stop_codon:yes gene_type:complete
MDFLIVDLLKKEDALKIKEDISSNESDWYDGRRTASGNVSVKRIRQLYADKKSYIESKKKFIKAFSENWLVMSFTEPKLIHSVQFSRAKAVDGVPGGYGLHWDKPYMGEGNRCDLAFTLFLEETEKYDGGELFLSTAPQSKMVKLQPGQAIFYPCNVLHRVNDVTRGERFVVVGWIHSQISNHEYRTNLFNLESNLRLLVDAAKQSNMQFDTCFQSIANLKRSLGN